MGRACRFALLVLLASACRRDAARARVGIAIEPAWYAAVRLAQEDLGDIPMDIVADSTRNVQVTASALEYATWLADNGAAVVIGHSGSRGSVAASAVYADRDVAQVAPLATSRELAPQVFSLVPDDSAEGAFIGAFVDTALHGTRVALLYHNDEYGLGIRDGVVSELGRRKIAVVDERFLVPQGEVNVSLHVEPLLEAALRSGPDVLVLGARVVETRNVGAYLRRTGRRIPVVSGDGAYVLPNTLQARDLSVMDGMHIVRFWGPDRDSISADFARRFEARTGYAPEQAEAATYDAVMLVGRAVREGARTSGDFRRFLAGLGRERPPVRGLLSTYEFERGRPVRALMEMGVVRGGQLTVPASR